MSSPLAVKKMYENGKNPFVILSVKWNWDTSPKKMYGEREGDEGIWGCPAGKAIKASCSEV